MSIGNVSGPSGVYLPMTSTATTEPTAGPPAADGDPSDEVTGTVGADFPTFYRESWSSVARSLTLALGDRDLAVDATDEAMARAYARWSSIGHYDNPAGWAYRVGLNWARSRHRRLARRLPFTRATVTEQEPPTDPAVRAALLDLPLDQRNVVICRLFLDWSVAETAAALDIKPGTVRSRLHRALNVLQPALDHLR